MKIRKKFKLPIFPFSGLGKKFDLFNHSYNSIRMQENEKELNEQNSAETADFNINTDENAAGTTHLNAPLEEEDKLEKANSELAEQKDKYLRLMAEFDNFRRRTAKERLETIQTAGKDVIASLLDVLDDFDRAKNQMETTSDFEAMKEGVNLIYNKLWSVLQSKGLKVIETLNAPFDLETSEAIAEVEASPELKGKVVDEIRKGYNLNGKIIRFAKVVVGK